jgi:hypothetical protein
MSTGNVCRSLGGLGPGGRRFGRKGYAVRAQIGREQARSDSGPSRKRRWAGPLRHSGLAAWGCVSVREHVFVVGPRVHVVTRFVGAGSRSALWRSSGRRVMPRAQVVENLLHQARSEVRTTYLHCHHLPRPVLLFSC